MYTVPYFIPNVDTRTSSRKCSIPKGVINGPAKKENASERERHTERKRERTHQNGSCPVKIDIGWEEYDKTVRQITDATKIHTHTHTQ